MIHQLFSTAIYQTKLEGWEEWNETLLTKEQYMFNPDEGRPYLTGECRDKCLMHKDEDLLPFFTEVSESIERSLENAGIRTDMLIPYIMKSWFTIMSSSTEMTPHNHACSDLSFVYYVDPPPQSTLCFIMRENRNKYFGGIYDVNKGDDKVLTHTPTWINSSFQQIDVAAGDLVVFPGHLDHYVPRNNTDPTIRLRSVAGDVKLMLNPDKTDLDTGLIHYTHWRKFK